MSTNASDMARALKEYHDLELRLLASSELSRRQDRAQFMQSNPNSISFNRNEQVWRPICNSITNNAKYEMRIHIQTSSLITTLAQSEFRR